MNTRSRASFWITSQSFAVNASSLSESGAGSDTPASSSCLNWVVHGDSSYSTTCFQKSSSISAGQSSRPPACICPPQSSSARRFNASIFSSGLLFSSFFPAVVFAVLDFADLDFAALDFAMTPSPRGALEIYAKDKPECYIRAEHLCSAQRAFFCRSARLRQSGIQRAGVCFVASRVFPQSEPTVGGSKK